MEFVFSTIDSTNLEALRWSERNSSSSDVWFFAYVQTGGIGQRNRTWNSPLGGLYVSVLYRPPIVLDSILHRGLLTIVAGNTIYELTKRLLIEHHLDFQPLKIHWPNDIYYQDRKLSGILTQSTTDGRLVTGFGININATIPSSGNILPISLQEILHKNLDLNIIYRNLQKEWQTQLQLVENFASGQTRNYITQTESKLAWLGESVTIIHTDESRQEPQTGVLLGLTEQGALRLQTDSGERIIVSGSVRKTDNEKATTPHS